ncbi:MAG: hypothetical protein MHMPM18_005138, partial [Marteilia pararefringens]
MQLVWNLSSYFDVLQKHQDYLIGNSILPYNKPSKRVAKAMLLLEKSVEESTGVKCKNKKYSHVKAKV